MFSIPTTQAQVETAGKIDYTFGRSGKKVIEFDIQKSGESHQQMLLQPDEKILMTGYVSEQVKAGFDIYRMNNDGKADTTFGHSGRVQIPINGRASTMALQPDGKILLAGYQKRGKFQDMHVVRLLTDGSLDKDFGIQGQASISFSGVVKVSDIKVLENGEIIIAGDTYEKSWIQRKFAIACLLNNGQPDGNFGKNGKVTVEAGKYARCEEIAIQEDGKILAVGYAKVNEFHDFVLLRLHHDGREDHSFGTAGIQRIHIGKENDYATAVELLPTRKILVAGHAKSSVSGEYEFTLMRLHLDGTPDKAFGKDGICSINGGGVSYSSDITIQKDGNILLAGTSAYKYTVVRFNHRGILDSSFGKNGIKQLKKIGGHSNDNVSSLAVQKDGRILLAGICNYDFTMIRLRGNPYLQGIDEMLAFEYKSNETPERNYAEIRVAPGFQIKAWLKQDGTFASQEAMRGSGIESLTDDIEAYTQKMILNHGHFKIGEHCQLVIVRDSEEKLHYYINKKYAKSIVK